MYLSWDEQIITDFSDANIDAMYDRGYVFTRKGKGVMNQTRSLRIDLSKFELSSENRRILKKNEQLTMRNEQLPYRDYTWQIGKLAHDFYETKFGPGTFSANKVKELMTDPDKSNFNRVFVYSTPLLIGEPTYRQAGSQGEVSNVGYCIALETNNVIHYSYPFYTLTISNQQSAIPNMGLAMMLQAIVYAQTQGKHYIYLGSAQRPTDTYKLQFKGLEWWDEKEWNHDIQKLKDQLTLNSGTKS